MVAQKNTVFKINILQTKLTNQVLHKQNSHGSLLMKVKQHSPFFADMHQLKINEKTKRIQVHFSLLP